MTGIILAGFLLVTVNADLPDAESIKGVELKIPLRVYSADGLLISEFGDERRNPIALEEVPKILRDAVLASEDDRFYEHRGIDILGLARAAISNFRSGTTQQGASTITMQVARNFFLSREKTYIRKLREVMLAFKLEQILTKDEILHLYLNKIFLGHRAYGFGAAAQVYYGRSLNELTLSEVAMLAGLPKAPSSNNPLRNPDRATRRRNYVLTRMLDLELIDQLAYETASSAPVTATKHTKAIELNAPHIAEMVRAHVYQKYGDQAYWQGLSVHTTLLAQPQQQAERSLRKGLHDYDRRHGFRGALAQFDLNGLTIRDTNDNDEQLTDEEYLATQYGELLATYPESYEQVPALVIRVSQDAAVVFIKERGIKTILLNDAAWARRHLTVNELGERPERMAQIVGTGDVIYVEPKPTVDNDVAQGWQLSQLPNIGGALISLEPSSGRILSLVGGYDYFLNKYNRAVQSIRQPGSNIKPFIYSAAMEQGFMPWSLVSGAPIVMTDPTHGTVWRPENYSGKFYGPTRVRDALAKSMNLVSIRLLRSIGIPTAREYLERFGINMHRFSSSLTMALGSGGITPLELLSAYGVLANGGYRVDPYFIDRIENRDGQVIFRAATPEYCDECYTQYLSQTEVEQSLPSSAQRLTQVTPNNTTGAEQTEEIKDLSLERVYQAPRVMTSANNFLIKSMLKEVITRGTARKASVLERNDLAGKTGTTNDYVDAWFTGFNSKIATTMWIGFDDPKSMGRGEAGSKAALPVWIDYMRPVLQSISQDTEQIPEFMRAGWVNRLTGQVTDELDPSAVREYFPIEHLLPQPFASYGLNNFDGVKSGVDDSGINAGGLSDGLDLYNESNTPSFPESDKRTKVIETEAETEGLF